MPSSQAHLARIVVPAGGPLHANELAEIAEHLAFTDLDDLRVGDLGAGKDRRAAACERK